MRKTLPMLTLVLMSSTAFAQPYSTIWSVGDSLSDTGRTYGRTSAMSTVTDGIIGTIIGGDGFDLRQPKGDLYWQGRFSNGGVWIEHLYKMNGLTYNADRNLAWGGAVTGSARDAAIAAVIKHLEEQVGEEFRPKIDGNTRGFLGTIGGWFSSPRLDADQFGSKPLVTLWIGGNNFRQEVEDKNWHEGWFWSSQNFNVPKSAVLSGVATNLRNINDSFRSRSDVGQDGVTYYVPTVPDVSTTPKFAGAPDTVRTPLAAAIHETNRSLKASLYTLEDEFRLSQPKTRIVVIDAAALLNEVQTNPQAFGFKIGDKNCVNADTGGYANGCSASNVGDYLFWDQFHPTTKAHEMIAKYALDTDKAESGQSITLTFPYVANIEVRNRDFNGGIAGTGSLIKQGEATLQLRGNNTYTGGTRLDHGTVRVSSDSNLGARSGQLLMRGGTLNSSASFTMTRDVRVETSVSAEAMGGSTFGGTFNADAGTTLTLQDNTLHGTGDIAKTGQGTVDLRSTVADARDLTSVAEGLLKINTTNDYRSTDVVVAEQGALGGSGTIVGKVTNHGRLAPGNSIGTLTIEGDYEQTASGTFVVDVDNHRSDTFHVTGTKVVDGEVHIALEPSAKMSDQRFTFVTAAGGIQGEYDEVTDLSPFLSQTLHHGTHSVDVSFERHFQAPARTSNQRTLADYVGNAFSTQSQGDLDAVYYALDHTVTDAGGRAALDALSGSTLGNLTIADAFQRGQTVRAIEDRLADQRAGRDVGVAGGAAAGAVGSDASGLADTLRAAAQGAGTGTGTTATWARVLGGPGHTRGANAFDQRSATILLGADRAIGAGLAGVSLGYGNLKTDSDDGVGRTQAHAYQFSVYGSANAGRVFVDGTAAYTYVDYDTTRRLTFGGLGRQANGSPSGHDVSLATKVGTRYTLGGWQTEPSLGLDYYRLYRSGFTESGAGAASLTVASQTRHLVMPSIGVRLARTFDVDGHAVSPELRARYYHQLGERGTSVTATMAGIGGAGFRVDGASLGRSTGVLGASLSVRQSERLQLFASYDATLNSTLTAHTFSAGLTYRW